MENLIIKATKSSPAIHLDAQTRILEITGESYPENAAKFYAPIFEWIDLFFRQKNGPPVTVNITLHYFNSSSSKILMDIFDRFEKAQADGTPIIVNWRYHEENDTAVECGEEFKEGIECIAFNMVGFCDEDY
jgi:hypothetical protein